MLLIPITADGQVDPRFGRAGSVALADFGEGAELLEGERGWREVAVGWDVAHEQGTHGAHHARIVRFLRDESVDAVVAAHVGEGMLRTLEAMKLPVVLGASGDARHAARAAARLLAERSDATGA